MTFKTLFSKQERERIALEARKATIRSAPEVASFVRWYENEVKGKKDSDINYVQLGYEAHDHYWYLVRMYPDLAILARRGITCNADGRSYNWLDPDFTTWHEWDKKRMEEHYKKFIDYEKEHHIYGDYDLSSTGALGAGGQRTHIYEGCAYLSYAFFEKNRWEETIRSIKEIIS